MSVFELCTLCGGDGRTFDEGEPIPRACVCKLRQMFRARVGEEVFEAEKRTGATCLHAGRNMRFRAEWDGALPHVRQALLSAWLQEAEHQQVVTTDLRVVDEGLSHGAAGIEALIGAQYNLVIVRLGYVPGKNSAAADALLSALRYRVEVWRAPVWVTDTPSVPFVRGHFAWSETLKTFIEKNFVEVRL